MNSDLPLQPWRVCLIRHIAAKVRLFRGDETYNICLICPQVTDVIGITATDIKSEVEDMAKTGRQNSRVTCKTCGTPDSFNFSQGNCRTCHFETKGIQDGSTIKKTRLKYGKPGANLAASGIAAEIKEDASGGLVIVKKEDLAPVSGAKCSHVLGVLRHHPAPETEVIESGRHYYHLAESAGIELFEFCPRCGKKLAVKAVTVPSEYVSTFSDETNGGVENGL
jgi:ribosomal protein L37E